MTTREMIIIGAGPGGYVAAIRASQLGFKVTIVEKEHLGGVCLNWGCIPTKALLRSAEIYHLTQHSAAFGIKAENISFDLQAIVQRSRSVAGQLAGGIKGLLKKNKVEVIEGRASFKGPQTIEILKNDGQIISKKAPHVIIATGARARDLPSLKEEKGIRIWQAREAMTPAFMPQKLLVIGSGAIGIEFASFYQTLGAKVTVVEMQDRILPQEDAEISAFAQKTFEKQGVTFCLRSSVEEIKETTDCVKATIKSLEGSEKNIQGEFDAVIVAIGIVGNVENLGLEKTKVVVEKGQIQVNEYCETAEKGIYAIGDVAGAPWLAHKASHEAILCVEAIAGVSKHTLKRSNIPGCTYSLPQVASVGMTEAAAKAKGIELKVGRFPFLANGKAIALGEASGLVKTIFDAKTGELLGAHMIGAEVTEMIQGFVISKTLEATEEELIHTIFPHPTLSEMMHESVLDALGKVIHY